MGRKDVELTPSLWRTCRALMNATRLNMLRMAISHEGALCVRDYARHFEMSDAIASIYLRQLNARGLLGVKRDAIKVFYNGETDRSLPDSVAIQKTLRRYFEGELKPGWETELMTILRVFTHFNRLAILVRLAKGPAELPDLKDAMGVIEKTIHHHLGFLMAGGFLHEERRYHRPAVFTLVRNPHPLAKTLLSLTLKSAEEGASYYNEGSGRGKDRATRAVLKKISRAENNPAVNWRKTGPKHPKRGSVSKNVVEALTDPET